MWSGGGGVRKQFRQSWFSLLLHAAAVGHSEQVDSVPVQRFTQKLPVVINRIWSTAGWRERGVIQVRGKSVN